MVTASIPQKPKVDISEVYRLIDAGHSQSAVSRQLGCTQSYISRLLKRRDREPVERAPTSNGNLPAIPASQPIAVPSPHIAVASPSIAADMDELRARVATLEAFMAVVQSEHRSASQPIAMVSQPIATHRHEPPTWVSRGLQVAADMLPEIDAYAAQYHLEKREVLDLALRMLFAQAERTVPDA